MTTFKARSTGEVVAKRDGEGRFIFADFWQFNSLVEGAAHGEEFIDGRGHNYPGDELLSLLERSPWRFEQDEEDETAAGGRR